MKNVKKFNFFSFLLITSSVFLIGVTPFVKNSKDGILIKNDKNDGVTVNNVEEFKKELINENTKKINLGSDIDLSNEKGSGISTQNKVIVGNGYSIKNYNLAQDNQITQNDFFINDATDVYFEGVVFDNVEFFINKYTFDNSTKEKNLNVFDNVVIKNMNLQNNDISTDVKGIFINNFDLTWTTPGEGDNLSLFSKTTVKTNVIENNVFESNDTIGILIGSINISGSSAYNTRKNNIEPNFINVKGFSFIDNDINGNNIKSSSIINNYDSNSENIFFSMSSVLVAQNNFSTDFSFLSTTGNSTIFSNSGIHNFILFNNNQISETSKNDVYIISSNNDGKNISLAVDSSAFNDIRVIDYSKTVTEIKSQKLFKGISDIEKEKLPFEALITYTEDDNFLRINLNDSIGIQKYFLDFNSLDNIFSNNEKNEAKILRKIVVSNKLSFETSGIELTRTKKKLGKLSINFSIIFSDNYFLGGIHPNLNNSFFQVGDKKFKSEKDKLEWNGANNVYKATFDFKGLELKKLYKDDVTFNTEINLSNKSNELKNIEISLDNDAIKNIIESKSYTSATYVTFINTTLGIVSIIFLIIIIIIITLLILWFIKVYRDKKETERLYGSDNYRYVQNQPVPLPTSESNDDNFDDQFNNDYNESYDYNESDEDPNSINVDIYEGEYLENNEQYNNENNQSSINDSEIIDYEDTY